MQPNPETQSPFIQQPPQVQLIGQTKTPPIFDPAYVALMDYMCKFEVPEKYRNEFEKYKPVLTQALMLANIKEQDVFRYRDMLHMIIKFFKVGLPHYAREWMLKMVVELALTRSIGMKQQITIATSRYVSVTEGMYPTRELEEKKRRRFRL